MKKKTVLIELNTMQKENLGLKPKQLRRKGNILQDVTNELSRGNPGTSSQVISSLIDRQDAETVNEICKTSKKINESNVLSPEIAVDILTAGNLTWNQTRQISRGATNGGKRLFPSEDKMRAAKQEKLAGITEDQYEKKSIKLQIRRQGLNKHALEFCALVYVKNYRTFLELILRNEISDEDYSKLNQLDDGSREIEIGLTGDGGGGSVKFLFSIIKEEKLIQHMLMIYEAADTLLNLIRCFSHIRQQLKQMNGAKINVEGKRYTVKQKGKHHSFLHPNNF
jgi:hypothetical protein